MPADARAPLRLRLQIRGHVQGVGFRECTRIEALRLGVRGWVRNRGDGSVEAVLEGETAAVRAMERWCRRGPSGARVTEVQSAAEPAADENGFRVVR